MQLCKDTSCSMGTKGIQALMDSTSKAVRYLLSNLSLAVQV